MWVAINMNDGYKIEKFCDSHHPMNYDFTEQPIILIFNAL